MTRLAVLNSLIGKHTKGERPDSDEPGKKRTLTKPFRYPNVFTRS